LVALFSLKLAERSEAKSTKRNIFRIFIFETKLRFALLASLRSAFLAEIKGTINWPLYPQELKRDGKLRIKNPYWYFFDAKFRFALCASLRSFLTKFE
jgi:hypothetical protein